MEKEEWKVSLPRKLTADETTQLQNELRPILLQAKAEEDYINDVIEYSCSMISNQKSVNYVVAELIGMEFDFLPAAVVETIAEKIQLFLASVSAGGNNGAEAGTAEEDAKAAEDKEQTVKSRLVSTKSNVQNALTMSGALGASREGGRRNNQNNKQTPRKDKQQQSQEKKESGGGGKGNRNRQQDNKREDGDRRRDNNNQNNRGRDGGQRDNEDRGRRDRHGRAFDRLREGRGRGPRGGGRGGRDGPRGGGRDDRQGGGRGPRGGRGGGDRRVAGNRRDRDEFQQEADFVPAQDPRGNERGGRDDGRGGRGGRGRGGRGFDPNKRQRVEQGTDGGQYDEYQESYDEGYYNDYDYYPPQRGGPPRGGGRWGGRGRGRGFRGGGGRFGGRGGRGRGGDFGSQDGWTNNEVAGGEEGGDAGYDETAGAAAVHPSPVVQANYGGFRGRGFRGRGRGRFSAGRAHVKNILASKTWVRKKDGEGNDEAGEGAGPVSETPQDAA